MKDLVSKLVEHNELNQTAIVSYCGLNLKKHKTIIYELESNELISKEEVHNRKRTIAMYRTTQKGEEFFSNILQPYENMFPRKRLQKITDTEKHKDVLH